MAVTKPTGAVIGNKPAMIAQIVMSAAPAVADTSGEGVGVLAAILAICGARRATNPMGPTTETTTATIPVDAIRINIRVLRTLIPRLVEVASP